MVNFSDKWKWLLYWTMKKKCLRNMRRVIAWYDWKLSTSLFYWFRLSYCTCLQFYLFRLSFFLIYAHALLFIKPDYSTCIYDLLVFISIHVHASMQGSDWLWRYNEIKIHLLVNSLKMKFLYTFHKSCITDNHDSS